MKVYVLLAETGIGPPEIIDVYADRHLAEHEYHQLLGKNYIRISLHTRRLQGSPEPEVKDILAGLSEQAS